MTFLPSVWSEFCWLLYQPFRDRLFEIDSVLNPKLSRQKIFLLLAQVPLERRQNILSQAQLNVLEGKAHDWNEDAVTLRKAAEVNLTKQ
jgi:hypothetical protein